MVIWLTTLPSTIHVVYVWPLTGCKSPLKFELFSCQWGDQNLFWHKWLFSTKWWSESSSPKSYQCEKKSIEKINTWKLPPIHLGISRVDQSESCRMVTWPEFWPGFRLSQKYAKFEKLCFPRKSLFFRPKKSSKSHFIRFRFFGLKNRNNIRERDFLNFVHFWDSLQVLLPMKSGTLFPKLFSNSIHLPVVCVDISLVASRYQHWPLTVYQ